MKIKVMVVDDHSLFRSGLIHLLEENKEIEVVGEAENGLEALNKLTELNPNVVFMDISMPIMDGIEATKKITELKQDVKIIALTMHRGIEYLREIFNNGAKGYLTKSIVKNKIFEAIREVVKNNYYVSSDVLQDLIEDYLKLRMNYSLEKNNSSEKLTPKEIQVLKLISEGLTSSEIAQRLELSSKTIDTHRRNIIEKLNLKSLPELIKYAINFSKK